MAWNEPGGPGGKDPWGGRNDQQGPPDLDEVVRKLQNRLGGIFRSGRRSSSSGFGVGGLAALLVLVVIVWAASGIYIVNEGKRGVVLQFGAFKEITLPGPHWYPRFVQSVHKVDVEQVYSTELGYRADEGQMLTQDENIIDVKFAIQYQVREPQKYLFNVKDPDRTLRHVTEAAVREVVGKSNMDFVITGGRSEIVAQATKLVQETLDQYGTGLYVTNLTMQNAQAPDAVQDAFADAVKAREDEQRLKNEAEAYANDILPKARGAAARIKEESLAYKEKVIAEAEGEAARFEKILAEYHKAPKVTRERLYLDAMESVLGNSSKILVDTGGSNNLLYLPLDRLAGRSAIPAAQPNSGAEQSFTVEPSAGTPAVSTVEQRLRDDMRRREVR